MTHLLDINVMIAAAWPAHIAHARTVRWFASRQSAGVLAIATCPLTELGFLRLVTLDTGIPAQAAVELIA